MISVERIRDPGLVIQAVTHPRVWHHSSDDFSPSVADMAQYIDCERQMWLGCWHGEEYLGCFLFQPHNHVLWEVHTVLLPIAWGALSSACAAAALEWVWSNLPAKRLVTSVPENNPLALRFAQRSGFDGYGFNPGAIQKNGKLLGLHMLGITKPGELSCPQQQP